jgi:hypothetical protein
MNIKRAIEQAAGQGDVYIHRFFALMAAYANIIPPI